MSPACKLKEYFFKIYIWFKLWVIYESFSLGVMSGLGIRNSHLQWFHFFLNELFQFLISSMLSVDDKVLSLKEQVHDLDSPRFLASARIGRLSPCPVGLSSASAGVQLSKLQKKYKVTHVLVDICWGFSWGCLWRQLKALFDPEYAAHLLTAAEQHQHVHLCELYCAEILFFLIHHTVDILWYYSKYTLNLPVSHKLKKENK